MAKKVKVDDENDDAKTIKNSDLDSKLDKILDIFKDKKKIDKQCIKSFTIELLTEESDLIRKLKDCRSMKEITELGFVYDMELRYSNVLFMKVVMDQESLSLLLKMV